MSDCVKIALCGPPCSGKSTLIEKLKRYYQKKSYSVFVVKETATELLLKGADRSNVFEFEKAVLNAQLEAEAKVYDTLDGAVDEGKKIIFFDRSLIDVFSYLNDDERSELLESSGLTIAEIFSRYDCVFYLDVAPEEYYSSIVREESYADSVAAGERLLRVVTGHPHLRFVRSYDDINDKLAELITLTDSVLSDIEYEKKYLIAYPDSALLNEYAAVKVEIEQIYLSCANASHRIRKRGVYGSFSYYETVKVRISGDKCYEFDDVISEKRYNELKKNADPEKKPIVKNRYCFLYSGKYFELDVFPFWNDRALLEVELVQDEGDVELPPKIKIIKDVSRDKEYKNSYLSRVDWNNDEDCKAYLL